MVYLTTVVKTKGENSKVKYPGIGCLPADVVYEKGFDPLQGGFKAVPDKKFEVFDQWIEVVPTDQIVAVEVKYDPKTGKEL